MVINFNIERLEGLLQDFYRITGLTVSVWDADFNMLAYQPKQMCGFCRRIREYPEGRKRCYQSDKAVCSECAATGKPATRICHAGLMDSAVPIKFRSEILGFMMFGQATGADKTEAYPKIRELSRELGADYGQLIELYGELDAYDDEKIRAAAHILEMSARFLWLSEHIEIKSDPSASLLASYVRKNISGDLSLDAIRRGTGLSKNRLYSLAHNTFGTSLGDYIASVRIKEAKRLLASTDLSVAEVCERVGVHDYNYFSKFFKNHTGISPSQYRKNYPFEM